MNIEKDDKYKDSSLSNSELLISIIVPIFNASRYLDECIASVINQTYSKWQLILIDDGSTDKSAEICISYVNRDNRIEYHHKNNSGQFESRRLGIRYSRGKYLMFLDSDDMLEKNALERVVYFVNKTKCDCIVFGVKKLLGNTVCDVWKEKKNHCIKNKTELYKKVLSDAKYNALWRKAVNASLFDGVAVLSNMNIKNGEDLLESLQLYKEAKNICFVTDVLYSYRYNTESITHKIDYKKLLDDTLYVDNAVLRFLDQNASLSDVELKQIGIGYIVRLIDIVREIVSRYEKEERIALLEYLYNDSFYQAFVKKQRYGIRKIGGKSVVLFLFNRRKFGVIFYLESIYKVIRHYKNRIVGCKKHE